MTFQPLTCYNGIQHVLVLIGNSNCHIHHTRMYKATESLLNTSVENHYNFDLKVESELNSSLYGSCHNP